MHFVRCRQPRWPIRLFSARRLTAPSVPRPAKPWSTMGARDNGRAPQREPPQGRPTLLPSSRERTRADSRRTAPVTSSSDDINLFEAWRAGEPEAGSALLRKYVPSLRRFFQTRVALGSEDLVQQTLLACFESAHRFRGESSFKTYLMAIARGQLLMHLRGQGRKAHRLGTLMEDVEDLEPDLRLWEEQGFVSDALRRIPSELRQVLELHYWHELKVDEIALLTHVAPGTVKSRLARGRKMVRLQLERTAVDGVPLRMQRSDSSCSAM